MLRDTPSVGHLGPIAYNMKKSFLMALQSPQGSDHSNDQVQEQSIVVPTKLITISDSLREGEVSWYFV